MDRLKTVFSIDLRSMALFRVCLALLLIWDLILRSFDMSDFYTDDGVLPRRFLVHLSHQWQLSLHAASGELWWQILLFVIAFVFALGLLVGYRSKLMAAASWFLLMSLINRNALILQGGDILLVVMCFWSLFLPIGARWSIDAALQPELRDNPNLQRFAANHKQPYFSMATVAVIFQVLYLYFFTALLKTGAAWRVRFDAAFYAVSLQHFATPIGVWMRQLPWLLKIATFGVLAVEFFAPILVLIPFGWPWTRVVGLLMLASLHVAFALMLHIGLFPFIDFMSLSLLIPSVAWVWLAGKRSNPRREAIILYYDEDCGFCLKMCLILREFLLPNSVKILQAQAYPDIHAIMEKENSWVVTDADGKPYVHWNAMQFLFSQSWPFKPLGWLMKLPSLLALGNRLYRKVADNRAAMGDFTSRWMPFRPINLRPTRVGQVLALFFFYVVTTYNISVQPGFSQYRFKHVDYAAHIARIDQRWGMFVPFPLIYSMYPLVQGELRNGDSVNLYEATSSSDDWQPPESFYPLYESYRWRKFLSRVNSYKSHAIHRAYGDYLCRSWNRRDIPQAQQLATLEVKFDKFYTNTEDQPKKKKRDSTWQHWCFAEFAPAGNKK
jgi:predicted DCC family thiol-disulfide oxidoreductase YuxK